MKKSHPLRIILCLLLVIAAVIAVFARGFLFRGKADEEKTLRIVSEGITGNFNPFYADSPGDLSVNNQAFMRIQRRGNDNRLTNSAGSISYEYLDADKVKYTVTIKKNLYFSDGTNVTIDDVIFFYYLCADATYDGVFSDFYLNDIQGLKEYYYDDKNYKTALEDIKGEKARAEYIDKNYGNGISVKEISGIKRVDDYTCTVLFNSRNINAVSALNAFIVSKAFYSAEYVKGNAALLKDFTTLSLGCGPYFIADFDKENNTASLKRNKYFREYETEFASLEILDADKMKTDAVKSVISGKADVATVIADTDVMSAVTSGAKYLITDDDSYISLFVNTKKIPDEIVRRQIMKACTVRKGLDSRYGSYYTKLSRPLSVRFAEYPGAAESYYEGGPVKSIIENEVKKLSLYCVGDENSPEKTAADDMAVELNAAGIKTTVTLCDYAKLRKDAKSGKADLWVMSVKDGGTCDKYDWYHTGGRFNLTGISDEGIDSLCERLRSSTGFTDKKTAASLLLDAIMEQSVELPVCQLERVTVYNSDILNDDIINSLFLNF